MDPMDIDHTINIPDTPDRLSTRGINVRSGVKDENHSSPTLNSRKKDFFEEGSKDQPLVIDSGGKRLSPHPRKTSTAAFSLASSSSSGNSLLFRKKVTEKNPTYKGHVSIHTRDQNTARPSCISESSSTSRGDSFVERTERNLNRPVLRNGLPLGVPGKVQAEFRKKSGLANGASSSVGPTNFSNNGEGTDNMGRGASSINHGKRVEIVGNVPKKPGNGGFLSLDPMASPRVNRQKRLVRNGCISPNNIAKGKQLAREDNHGSHVAHTKSGSMASSACPVSVDIMELVAEDSDSHIGKGKGVMSHPYLSKESDFKNRNLHSRSPSKKSVETSYHVKDAGKSTEEFGGWRSTRNRTRKTNLSLSDEERYANLEMDTPGCSSQHHENRTERRGKGSVVETGNDYPKDPNSINSEQFRGSAIHPETRLGRLNGHHSAANALIKRQKQGSTSSTLGESSTSAVSDDPEVVFLGSSSSAEPSNPTTSSGVGNLQPVIEVDEFSPQLRRNAQDEEVRARQLEADERLARELQEQLYNDVSVFGGDAEVDENIALALQNQDDSYTGVSRARRPTLTRGSATSNLHRQIQSRSSSNSPRRGALARASTLGRTSRIRGRFPGQPRTMLPSRGRTSLFPANMDVDMRMHILGTLEAFGDLGVGPGAGILQTNRDFNEDDYEMLLALDENNDRHSGASVHRINGLPESTVQNDNYQEACAVCLETPTIGDTIRHLPCLHKFHKDCIDPWLRRKTSCPVCKCSIT